MGERKRRDPLGEALGAVPDLRVGEILNGELVVSPRPAGPHAFVTNAAATWISSRYGDDGSHGGWIILGEPELHLGDNVLVPDIAGWRVSRMSEVDDVPYFTLPPDWACETLSKWTEKYDRVDKSRIYADHGVGHLWFLNPMRRMLEVFRRLDRDWLCLGVYCDADRVRAEPFEAVELDLAKLWSRLKKRPPRATGASEPWAEYEADL